MPDNFFFPSHTQAVQAFWLFVYSFALGRGRKDKNRRVFKCFNSMYDIEWAGWKKSLNASKPTLRHGWAYFQVKNN